MKKLLGVKLSLLFSIVEVTGYDDDDDDDGDDYYYYYYYYPFWNHSYARQ